jgi:Glycosyl hydrolase catalytic core
MGSTVTTDRRTHRPARRPLWLVAAAGVVAMTAWPVSAGAAPKGFLGVVQPFGNHCGLLDRGGKCLSREDLVRMQKAQVRIVRWGFRWSRAQPMRLLPPNWGITDAMIGSLASRRIRVLPVLTGSPSWAAKTPETPPLKTPAARDGWRRFVTAAVDRYGPGGEYWTSRYPRQFPGRPIRPITTWQVWNEQNLVHTFPPRPAPRKYARLLRITDEAIAAADPHAEVLLGGMPGYVQPRAWEYLDRLYRQPGIRNRFDAVALHPYSPDVEHVMVQVRRIRQAMRAHHDGRTPIWVTELGWGSDPPDQFGINVGAHRQKQILQRAFRRLIHNRHRWRLEHVLWFDWRDPPPGSGRCSFCDSSGLFSHDQEPKPAWRAFKRVAAPFR